MAPPHASACSGLQKFLKCRPPSCTEAHTAFAKQKTILPPLREASQRCPLALRIKSKLLPGLTEPCRGTSAQGLSPISLLFRLLNTPRPFVPQGLCTCHLRLERSRYVPSSPHLGLTSCRPALFIVFTEMTAKWKLLNLGWFPPYERDAESPADHSPSCSGSEHSFSLPPGRD